MAAKISQLDEITVGELRQVLSWSGDENLTIAEILEQTTAATRLTAEHEDRWRRYQAYLELRKQRLEQAIMAAAAGAQRGQGSSGAQAAARRAAQIPAAERFHEREPRLATFDSWISAGEPEIHQVTAVTAAVKRATAAVQELVS